MSSAKVGLGLGARGLKDKDWGPGVSDPYVVISRWTLWKTFKCKRYLPGPRQRAAFKCSGPLRLKRSVFVQILIYTFFFELQVFVLRILWTRTGMTSSSLRMSSMEGTKLWNLSEICCTDFHLPQIELVLESRCSTTMVRKGRTGRTSCLVQGTSLSRSLRPLQLFALRCRFWNKHLAS